MLGITRAAVWKRILVLKKEGWQIEASTRKGYRLSQSSVYNKAGIQSHLETQLLGRELIFLQSLDSTNNYLKTLASEGACEGTAVIADAQTHGRGRLGRSWSAVPGVGIWLSVLLKPQCHPSLVHSVTLMASVAVCKALEPYLAVKPGIKWPNDILLGGKKLCGILTELSAEADRISWLVIGIGINVNHTLSDFPEEIANQATSMLRNKNENILLDRSQIAAAVLNHLEACYFTMIHQGTKEILDLWKSYSITLGRKVRLSGDQIEPLEATALDIAEDGRLIVELEDGMRKEILSGEISLRTID